MKKSEVIEYFGNVEKTATALGITKGAVSQWGEDIPMRRAYEVERISEGRLKILPLELSKPYKEQS